MKMEKELQENKDYGEIFGLDREKGQHMIYLGNNVWRAINGDVQKDIESPKQSKRVLEYINRPVIKMGSF